MLETERADAIFADAHVLYADALEELDRGNLRNAAEKAWGATKRATDALILARTGREPRTCGADYSFGVRALRRGRTLSLEEHPKFVIAHPAKYACARAVLLRWRSVNRRMTLSPTSGRRLDYIHDARSLAGGQA